MFTKLTEWLNTKNSKEYEEILGSHGFLLNFKIYMKLIFKEIIKINQFDYFALFHK